jgi:hypothetical protein
MAESTMKCRSAEKTRLLRNHACFVCESFESREVGGKAFLFSLADIAKSENCFLFLPWVMTEALEILKNGVRGRVLVA